MKTYLHLRYLAEFFLECEMFETNVAKNYIYYVGQLFPKIVPYEFI